MRMFWTLLVIDVALLLLMGFLYLQLLHDGNIDPSKSAPWLALIGVSAAAVMGGLLLNSKGRTGTATALLALPAILLSGFIVTLFAVIVSYAGITR